MCALSCRLGVSVFRALVVGCPQDITVGVGDPCGVVGAVSMDLRVISSTPLNTVPS